MRGNWVFTYRKKVLGMVPDVDPKNSDAVRERDMKLERCRRNYARAKEEFHKATK